MIETILILSVIINLIVVVFSLIIANYFKEELKQKLINHRHCADIVMFGDSHTAGGRWNSLIPGYSIKRLGWGGFTTEQLSRLIQLAIEYKPKYVFILCGGNDIGTRCFNIDNIIENFKFMSDTLRQNNIKPVFQKLLYQVNDPQLNAITDTINLRLINFCKNENIDFVDITKGMMNLTGLKKELTIDGRVHLNENGYKVWSKWINNYLKDNN